MVKKQESSSSEEKEKKSSFASDEASEDKEESECCDDLKKRLADAEKQKAEYLAGWQRARADFLNYKKEEIERIEELLKYAGVETILKLLPILDSFDLAEKELPNDLKKEESIKGMLQIKNQILEFLTKQGVEEIKIGEIFDPNFHEAVEEIEQEGEESGKILEAIQKGYLLNGKVMRPAKVKVSK